MTFKTNEKRNAKKDKSVCRVRSSVYVVGAIRLTCSDFNISVVPAILSGYILLLLLQLTVSQHY